MPRTKIVIVEDEILIADNMCEVLQKEGYEVLEPCINYTEALEIIHSEKPDIAILDIQLSGKKTGIDLADYINKNVFIPFIFLTSNSDKLTFNEAKLVQPNSFLVKPFNKEELVASIELALFNFSRKNEKVVDKENLIIRDSIFIKNKRCFERVSFNEITFIKSENVYLDIYLQDGQKYTVRDTMTSFITKLNEGFVRVHRSFIINTQFLKRINSFEVEVNDQKIPISMSYAENLLSRLSKS